MPLILCIVTKDQPHTQLVGSDDRLLELKRYALDRANQLAQNQVPFHLYLADTNDHTRRYLEVFNEEGCLGRPGTPGT